MDKGSEFQVRGATYENDLSPYDLVFILGSISKNFLQDRKLRDGL